MRIEQGAPKNLADITEFLDERLADEDLAPRLRQHGVSAAELAAELVGRCAGVWVYLRTTVESWADHERRRRGTRKNSRALTCFRQAVLGLRWFRQDVDVTALARDHEVSRATGYRYLEEVIEVLADQAPELHEALEKAKADGLAYVILDGKIFSADRCDEKTLSVKGKQIDLWYSGKAHEHGGNIQAVMEPGGFPLWVADVEPGSVHDLTVAREHVLGALYWAASHLDLPTLSDGGYEGAGIGVHTPIKQPAGDQVLHVDNRTYNALLRGLRCLGERGFAVLTGRWRALHHTTASPSKIGHIVKVALVLTHFEHGRLN